MSFPGESIKTAPAASIHHAVILSGAGVREANASAVEGPHARCRHIRPVKAFSR
jgi:hypothetical protein